MAVVCTDLLGCLSKCVCTLKILSRGWLVVENDVVVMSDLIPRLGKRRIDFRCAPI